MFAFSYDTPIAVDIPLLTFIVGSLIPLVVAVLTKANASSSVKATANVVLSVVGGVVAFLLAHDGEATGIELVTAAIAAYLASGVAYTHFHKPTGLAPTVAAKTAGVGIG